MTDADKPSGSRNEETSPSAPRELLREYDPIKLELAAIIREVLGETENDTPAWREGRELLVRLAEDRFNVDFFET